MSLFRGRAKTPATVTPPDGGAGDPVSLVLGYHRRSKHDFQRYAASLGYLDWANQPDPFRRFVGAPVRPLDLERAEHEGARDVGFDELFTPGVVAPRAVDEAALSRFLYHSLGLSSAKRAGESHWFLRVNPSSGNLHPTEGWLILPRGLALGGAPDGGEPPALWHYAPHAHALEQRAVLRAEWADALFASLPEGGFLIALSSIAWREAWKYGERAYRYVNHDVGHALGALRYAAALCGWTLERAPAVSGPRLAELLGLDLADESPEAETPDLLVIVRPAGTPRPERHWAPPPGSAFDALQGEPNALSEEHHPWPVIAMMEELCRDTGLKPPMRPEEVADGTIAGTAEAAASPADALPPDAAPRNEAPFSASRPSSLVTNSARELVAGPLIRSRRSAVSMDRSTRLSAAAFYRMLAATHPELTPAPFDALVMPPRVHLFLFVHRVDDLAPGIYLLPRDEAGGKRLHAAMHAKFDFATPEGCPPELPLLRLVEDDTKSAAARVSCGQDIAADGVFSLGMLAELEPTLRLEGPSAYPHLYWETGLIGQVLYLQAQAAGISATGIGCFFDDPVHSLAGLRDASFQSLYHFTVGGGIRDDRIVDEPAYAHLAKVERGTD